VTGRKARRRVSALMSVVALPVPVVGAIVRSAWAVYFGPFRANRGGPARVKSVTWLRGQASRDGFVRSLRKVTLVVDGCLPACGICVR
jgi:hypothetical protein